LKLALVFIAAALLVTACSRDKDPYRDWKAPQLLEEGDRLLRAGDLDAAGKALRRGLERAEKDGFKGEHTRVFLSRLGYIAAARENRAEAEQLFSRMGGVDNPRAMDLRLATQLVLLLQKEGKVDQARALGEKIVPRLEGGMPAAEEMPFHLVGWIVVDRLRTANVEIGRAKEASDAFVAALTALAEASIPLRQPLPPGLRGWITRYIDHLYDSDRSLVAKQVADLVGRIDEVALPADDRAPCLLLDPLFPALGCLADWPK
jgi:tetratricopeptide (TPR) repeat protein